VTAKSSFSINCSFLVILSYYTGWIIHQKNYHLRPNGPIFHPSYKFISVSSCILWFLSNRI